jgi:hypothetical protein
VARARMGGGSGAGGAGAMFGRLWSRCRRKRVSGGGRGDVGADTVRRVATRRVVQDGVRAASQAAGRARESQEEPRNPWDAAVWKATCSRHKVGAQQEGGRRPHAKA